MLFAFLTVSCGPFCAIVGTQGETGRGLWPEDDRNDQGRDGVLDRNASVKTELAPAGATPTVDAQPRRLADFATIGEALDYAATGQRGLNFHDARGALTQAYSYAELREDALARWPASVLKSLGSLGTTARGRQTVARALESAPSDVAVWRQAVLRTR
jgi:hypothetical protein